MRAITGYDAEARGRNVSCRAVLTKPDLSTLDISDYLMSVQVTDALGEPSRAQLEVAWGRDSDLDDPSLATDSWLAAGNGLTIEFAEPGVDWVRVFDGTVVEGTASSDGTAVRLQLGAVGGRTIWWDVPITSAEYAGLAPEAVVKALFVAYGGLADPTDFDLPATGRVLTRVQIERQSLMQAAANLLAPSGYAPWWNPVELKLTALPTGGNTPVRTVAATNLGRVAISWRAPGATRVKLDAGQVQGIQRLEIGDWPTPSTSASSERWGVTIASGSKSDWYDACYWADVSGNAPHANYSSGDYLWVQLIGTEDHGDGSGYRGPEGVDFLRSGWSTVWFDPENSQIDIGASVTNERWGEDEDCYIASALLRIDVTGLTPAPRAGEEAEHYWSQLVNSSDITIAFEIVGRQLGEEQVEQLHAEAWDDDLIAVFGDRATDESNPTLLTATATRANVEAEAERLLARLLERRCMGEAELIGMDLRLVPGDCLSLPHPRQGGTYVLRADSLAHSWKAGGGSRTSISGPVLGVG